MKLYKKNIIVLLFSLIITFWLGFRLIRFNIFFFDYWFFYIYLLIFFCVMGQIFTLLYTGPLIYKIIHGIKLELFQKHFLTILALKIIFVIQFLIFRNIDTYTIASLVFFLYFPLVYIFRRIDPSSFFKFFETILICLVLLCTFDMLNLTQELNVFDYSLILNKSVNDTTINSLPTGLYSMNPLFNFRGRPPGVSGTPYASSALIAASCFYFYFIKDLKKATIFFIIFLLYGTGSTAIIFLIFLIFNMKLSKNYILTIFIITPLFLIIIASRFGNIMYWVPFPHLDGNIIDFLLIFLIGEGTSIPMIKFDEIRGLALIFSFGILGCFFLITLLFLSKKSLTFFQNEKWYLKSRAAFSFILIILFCSWHYPTFMLFPNIVLVMMILAFITSQTINRYEKNPNYLIKNYNKKRKK